MIFKTFYIQEIIRKGLWWLIFLSLDVILGVYDFFRVIELESNTYLTIEFSNDSVIKVTYFVNQKTSKPGKRKSQQTFLQDGPKYTLILPILKWMGG